MKTMDIQSDKGDMVMLNKKKKLKRKRLKELQQCEDNKHCSDFKPEAVDRPPKENTTEEGKISKQSTGM